MTCLRTHYYSCLFVLFCFILQLSFSTALCNGLMCVYHVNKRLLLTYLLLITYLLCWSVSSIVSMCLVILCWSVSSIVSMCIVILCCSVSSIVSMCLVILCWSICSVNFILHTMHILRSGKKDRTQLVAVPLLPCLFCYIDAYVSFLYLINSSVFIVLF